MGVGWSVKKYEMGKKGDMEKNPKGDGNCVGKKPRN